MAKKKHSALGKRLIASAKEMEAYARGELELDEYEDEFLRRLTSLPSARGWDYLRQSSPDVSDSVPGPFRTGSKAGGNPRAPRGRTCW